VSDTGGMDRIPAYVRRVIQEPGSMIFTGQYWNPPTPYQFKNPNPKLKAGLRIYEAHVGMASLTTDRQAKKTQTIRSIT
jgi:1,4-alpha-glucan branching enzyme